MMKMNTETYLKFVDTLENKDFASLKERLSDDENIRLTHSVMGLSSEVGEFVDLVKKKIFYGKEFDKVKAVSELGDILWFLGQTCNTLGISLEDVMINNYSKLSTRFKTGYNNEAAIHKSDALEREAMTK